MSEFKSVSVRDNTFKEIKELSLVLLPHVKLSNAQTIDRITNIVKKSLKQTRDFYAAEEK